MSRPALRHLRTGLAGAVAAVVIAATGAPALAASNPQTEATRALGRGDGAAAAQIIARSGLFANPAALASIIYGGGVIAVDADKGNAFAQAVPVAFVRGKVTLVTANLAFEQAALIVGQEGAKDVAALVPQLAPGGLAIIRTELAYLGIWLPAFPD